MKETAIALGTFDGVHLGHKKVLQTAVNSGLFPVAVAFSVPPKAFLSDEKIVLSDLEEKTYLIKETGIKEIEYLDFPKLKDVSAEDFLIDYSFQASVFGMALPSYHLHLERKNKAVKTVKNELKLRGQARCKLCGRDLSDHYSVGSELLEVHISAPLYENNNRLTVSPSDLLVLCPTCHKLAHSRLDGFEEEKLKGYII